MSVKTTLIELDIGKIQTLFVNEAPFIWKLNLDGLYPGTESFLLLGYDEVDIVNIGSVKSDAVNLNKLNNLADVKAAPGSFYFDSVARNIFIHYPDSNDPGTHNTLIGSVFGYSNRAVNYNGVVYEARLTEGLPSITQSKDPLFFGKIANQSFSVPIANLDGDLDSFAEDNDWYGNNARVYIGEDANTFNDFTQVASGYLENISLSQGAMNVQVQDQRKQLSKTVPTGVFDSVTYPDIKEKNINIPIQLRYGILRNVEAICTNEEEAPTPTNYDFKFADTEFHEILSVDNAGKVFVEGVLITPDSIDLANGEFVITSASGDYTPGDLVTLDIHGYKDISGNLISNGLDIMKDLLGNYTTLKFNDSIYNVGEWTVAEGLVNDIGISIEDTSKISDILEEISTSLQTIIYFQGDGRLTAKKFDINFPSDQTFFKDELMAVPTVEYDTSEIITTVIVNHTKDWEGNDYFGRLIDDSQEAALFLINKTSNTEEFDTLLTNQTDALEYSETILGISGTPRKIVTTTYKLQPLLRNIGDFVEVPIWRPTKQMLNNAKVEILSKTLDLNTYQITLVGRVLEFITPTVTQTAQYWGGTYWGGDYWGENKQVEI